LQGVAAAAFCAVATVVPTRSPAFCRLVHATVGFVCAWAVAEASANAKSAAIGNTRVRQPRRCAPAASPISFIVFIAIFFLWLVAGTLTKDQRVLFADVAHRFTFFSIRRGLGWGLLPS
jgi:hypothetical protein